jgi:ABC-type amino acid transport substrate-binding protein
MDMQRAVSEELRISEEEVEARLDSLQVLLPAIKAKLAGMRAVLVTRLVADIDLLPARLMRLKAIFPGAAAGVLAMREPGLVLGYDLDVLQATAEELRRMLPSLDIGESEGKEGSDRGHWAMGGQAGRQAWLFAHC